MKPLGTVQDFIDSYEHCKQKKIEEISVREISECCALISGWLACNKEGYVRAEIVSKASRLVKGKACPICGTTSREMDIYYCPYCGTKLPEVPDEEEEE